MVMVDFFASVHSTKFLFVAANGHLSLFIVNVPLLESENELKNSNFPKNILFFSCAFAVRNRKMF